MYTMSGNEIIGKEELKNLKQIFTKSNGVLFSHSFIKRRKKIFRVENFEKLFARKLGTKYAIACSSGTAAGSLCLLAAGVKPGDEVNGVGSSNGRQHRDQALIDDIDC